MKKTMMTALMLFAAGSGYAATNYYVWRGNPSPTDPFTNWAMAATNIQLAVNKTLAGDTVYVTNGTYDTGGAVTPAAKLTNRVCITKAIAVCSMNGPGLTIIKGAEAPGGGLDTGAVRCVYMANVAASLIGFTLTGGYTMKTDASIGDRSGGGVCIGNTTVVSNCVISGNTAYNVGGGACLSGGTLNNCTIASNTCNNGGGAYLAEGGTVNNCMVAGNVCVSYGGGVRLDGGNSSLNNCMVVSNSGTWGAGVFFYYDSTINNCTVVSNTGYGVIFQCDATRTGAVNNCIVWGNTAGNIAIWVGGLVNYTCSDPAQTSYGNGNIGADPMFVDAGRGNYSLKNGSPCINTGSNMSWMTDGADVRHKDFAGHSRIDRFTGIVDMGAYEYFSSGTIFCGK